MGQDTKPRLRIPSDAAIQGPVPQPNPILKWIAEQGDNIVTGAETIAGFFDGNPAGEVAKAVALIPPKVAKQAGLELLEQLRSSGGVPESVMQALSAAQKRYPRLFGHVDEVRGTSDPGLHGAAYAVDDVYAVPGAGAKLAENQHLRKAPKIARGEKLPTGVALNMRTLDGPYPDRAASTVNHELAHVAQMLRRGPTFDEQYNAAESMLGYRANPYEVRARQAGGRASARATEERFRQQVQDAAPSIKMDKPALSTSKLRTLKLNTELSPVQRELEQVWDQLAGLMTRTEEWTPSHSAAAQSLRDRIRELYLESLGGPRIKMPDR